MYQSSVNGEGAEKTKLGFLKVNHNSPTKVEFLILLLAVRILWKKFVFDLNFPSVPLSIAPRRLRQTQPPITLKKVSAQVLSIFAPVL